MKGLLNVVGGAEGLFMHLYGGQGAQDTFWLDRCAQSTFIVVIRCYNA